MHQVGISHYFMGKMHGQTILKLTVCVINFVTIVTTEQCFFFTCLELKVDEVTVYKGF